MGCFSKSSNFGIERSQFYDIRGDQTIFNCIYNMYFIIQQSSPPSSYTLNQGDVMNESRSSDLLVSAASFISQDPSPLYPYNDSLVHHYMSTVVSIQYQLADKSTTARLIHETIQYSSAVCEAVRLLAAVHQHKCSTQLGSRALETASHPASQIYERLSVALLHTKHISYTQDNAMTALLIISSVLFDGGTGDWKSWLDVAYAYVDSVFLQYGGASHALSQMQDEKFYFIVKTTFWFDVIASVTLQEVPHYFVVIDKFFDPWEQDPNQYTPLFMMDAIGCHNDIFWAMNRVSALSHWKASCIRQGKVDVTSLLEWGGEIEGVLLHHANFCEDPPQDEEELCRRFTSYIFCMSTLAWLDSIMYGSRTHAPGLARSVHDVLQCFDNIPQDERIQRYTVRSSVFCIFICGIFTTKPDDRDFLVYHLRKQSSDNVGNCTAIENLMRSIWNQHDTEGKQSSVKWQEPLKASRILLV